MREKERRDNVTILFLKPVTVGEAPTVKYITFQTFTLHCTRCLQGATLATLWQGVARLAKPD